MDAVQDRNIQRDVLKDYPDVVFLKNLADWYPGMSLVEAREGLESRCRAEALELDKAAETIQKRRAQLTQLDGIIQKLERGERL
jgi:hypothetical protein